MKKLISSLFILAFSSAILFSSSVTAAADAKSVSALVAISDGSIRLAYAPVAVTDTDSDGKITIGDAISAAHIAYYPEGASGFSSEVTEYGISMTKLWGIENGGSYGYYLNNGSAMSLADEISEGDMIYAYAFTDLATWSDTYTYFDKTSAEISDGKPLELTLTALSYDASWQLVAAPLAGAKITVDGVATSFVTDNAGKVSLNISGNGIHLISAESDELVLVPPVCNVTVSASDDNSSSTTEKNPETGVPGVSASLFFAAVTALAAASGFKRNAK